MTSLQTGILHDKRLMSATQSGLIRADTPIELDQIQPASLDLRLGKKAYRLRASFLPNGKLVGDCLNNNLVMHEQSLKDGAVLETGCVYLVPLKESLQLTQTMEALTNPKSSTGRIDVFVRVICDKGHVFDRIPKGYEGPLYAEVTPRTFSILAREDDRLCQLRLREGKADLLREEVFSVDLSGDLPIIGYRAKRHSAILDLSRIGGHKAADYWEAIAPSPGGLILDPGEFYILASKEKLGVQPYEAAEMAAIAPEFGEFRAHYAGFFDPGFGLNEGGARAVLEVRAREAPFILEDGQKVGRLVYEKLAGTPDTLYGGAASNYQGQALKLSKHFS